MVKGEDPGRKRHKSLGLGQVAVLGFGCTCSGSKSGLVKSRAGRQTGGTPPVGSLTASTCGVQVVVAQQDAQKPQVGAGGRDCDLRKKPHAAVQVWAGTEYRGGYGGYRYKVQEQGPRSGADVSNEPGIGRGW